MITPSKTIRRPLKFKTVAEVNALHLVHCAHHLSFLDPIEPGPTTHN
jgi:hypothetical protein